jgi:predicted AAA+ superfamily ATPase
MKHSARPKSPPTLRVLADRPQAVAKFLIPGNTSPSLTRQAAESLAERISIIEMHGRSIHETRANTQQKLWLRGGFPRAYPAPNESVSFPWRSDFIRTFLEQDLSNLGFDMSPAKMRLFWTMLAHDNGQVWNTSEIAASMGIAPNS